MIAQRRADLKQGFGALEMKLSAYVLADNLEMARKLNRTRNCSTRRSSFPQSPDACVEARLLKLSYHFPSWVVTDKDLDETLIVKLGTIAVDGTKIKAKAADQAEKNEPELDIPVEITRREDRLAAIQAARAGLARRSSNRRRWARAMIISGNLRQQLRNHLPRQLGR